MQDFQIEQGVLIRYTGSGEEAVIPEGVAVIGEKAFFNCTGLKSVVIGNSVTSIGNWAFFNCKTLDAVRIPDSVTHIGEGAFSYCIRMKTVVIPDSVTCIEAGAFESCTSLTSVRMPEHITGIRKEAFRGCNLVESVTVGEWKFRYVFPDELLQILIEKNCSVKISDSSKNNLILQLFMYDIDIEGMFDYINAHFWWMTRQAFWGDSKIIQKMLDSGKIITSEDIDSLIEDAIQCQKYEIQLMLMDYKYQHFDFHNPADKLKL